LPEGGNLERNKHINQEKICIALWAGVADESARLYGDNAGELFAETLWYPAALLPSQGVHWEVVDTDFGMVEWQADGKANSISLPFHPATDSGCLLLLNQRF